MRGFFEVLYGTIPDGAVLEVRLIADPERDQGAPRRVKLIKQYARLDALPPTWRDDANVFFGVGLRTPGRHHAVLWPVLWADVDGEIPDDLPLPSPTATVRSGRGHHLYWRLREPLLTADAARRYLRAIQHAVGGADPRSAEPEHLLRVPGTWNVKYRPPLPVEVVEMHPDRVYDEEAFAALPLPEIATGEIPRDPITPEPTTWEEVEALLPTSMKALVWSGTNEAVKERFGSWSELDFALVSRLASAGLPKAKVLGFFTSNPNLAICRRLKYGKPAIEARDYLIRTIHAAYHKVDEQRRSAEAAGEVGLVVEHGRTYAVTPTGERRQITNFAARPLAVVEGPGGGIRTELHRDDGLTRTIYLTSKALSTPVHFRQALGEAFVFEGRDSDLTRLHKYLLRFPGVPIRRGVRLLGWHPEGLLTTAGLWGPDGRVIEDAPLVYTGELRWELHYDPEWAARARLALRLLLQLHEPEVVWALLGWTLTTFVAPRVRAARGGNDSVAGEFSGLWVWGEQGGGKSRTTEQFIRLTASPFVALAGHSSIAGLHGVFSETNVSPVFLDDPRKVFRGGRDNETELRDLLLNAFLASPVRKGKRDLSGTTAQPLWAPCVGTGEKALEGDAALAERYLHVPVDKPYLRRHPSCAQALDELTRLPLEDLAGGFFLWWWTVDVRAAWQRALALTEPLAAQGAMDRVRKSVAQILVGLEAAAEIGGLDYGASYSAIAEQLWRRSYEATGYDPQATYSTTLRDLMALVWNLMAKERLREGYDFRVIGDAIYFNLNRLLHEVEDATRYLPLPLSRTTVMRMLNTHNGDIVRGLARVRFAGGPENQPLCVCLNLTALREQMGLTESPWVAHRSPEVGE